MKVHLINDDVRIACNQGAEINKWTWTFNIKLVECTRCLTIASKYTVSRIHELQHFNFNLNKRLRQLRQPRRM